MYRVILNLSNRLALQILGKVIGHDLSGGADLQSSLLYRQFVSPDLVLSISESTVTNLVSSTWDLVVVLASSDVSLLVKTRAMALLVDYIPFAERRLLQSLLGAADSVYGVLAHPNCEGSLLRLSLALIAGACLYCPEEDISRVPGGFGSGQRHGSRGSKSRQVVERRERDGRREGKWQRYGLVL